MSEQHRDPQGRFARTPEQQHAELVASMTRRSKPLPFEVTNLGARRTAPPPGRIDPISPPVGRYTEGALRQLQIRRWL